MSSHDNIKAKKHAMDDNINDVIISKPKTHARDFDIFSVKCCIFIRESNKVAQVCTVCIHNMPWYAKNIQSCLNVPLRCTSHLFRSLFPSFSSSP